MSLSDEYKNSDGLIYKVGVVVPEDGYYVCAPCGNKKFFKAGMRFTSCLKCLGKERRLFRKGLELWEKFFKQKTID